MITLMLVLAVTGGDLTGFWHSEPDLSEGYGTCYFFWDSGEYAYLRSLDEGSVLLGTWNCSGEEMLLECTGAMGLDGRPVKADVGRIAIRLLPAGGEEDIILIGGESFHLLDTDPGNAIISLVPTYGMTESESEAFSTYD